MPIEWRPLKYGSEYLNYEPFCEYVSGKGMHPYVVIKESYKAVSAANVAFTTMTGNLTHLRVALGGSSSKLDVVSSSSNDKSAATGHIRSVRFWGVDSSNYLRVVSANLSGTTASSGATAMFEIGDIYHYTHGSGGEDAAGRIDIGVTGKATVEVMSIGSNQSRSLCSQVVIPRYWRAKILHTYVSLKDTATTADCMLLLFPHYYDAYDNEDVDSSHSIVQIAKDGKELGADVWPRIYGNDQTYSTLEFYGVRHEASETWAIKSAIALFPTGQAQSAYKHLQGV